MTLSEGADYNHKYKRALFDKINSLSFTEHEEILKIISKHDIPFSKNKNGVFFNLSTLTDPILKEIDEFVVYCVSNKKELDEYDKKLNECKLNNNFYTMLPQRHNLSDMGKKKEEAPTWNHVPIDDVQMEKFVKFVDRFHQDRDKVGKKKAHLKYNAAKKRYAKRVVVERKFENDGGDLLPEAYILT